MNNGNNTKELVATLVKTLRVMNENAVMMAARIKSLEQRVKGLEGIQNDSNQKRH